MAATPLFIQWAWLLDLADGGYAPINPVGVASVCGQQYVENEVRVVACSAHSPSPTLCKGKYVPKSCRKLLKNNFFIFKIPTLVM